MKPIYLRRVAVLCLLFITIPACNKRGADSPPPPPEVKLDPDPTPAPEGTIPPPRLMPLAAERSDGKDAMEVFVIAGEKGEWKVQYPEGQR